MAGPLSQHVSLKPKLILTKCTNDNVVCLYGLFEKEIYLMGVNCHEHVQNRLPAANTSVQQTYPAYHLNAY
jgi:hypothetical protein